MSNFKKHIDTLLEGVKQAYIQDQLDKGMKASGASARSLKKVAKPTGGQLTGADYFYQQIHGRAPGKFPPIEAMLKYIRVKKIQPRDGISLKSLAFLFARAIARRGTQIFQGKRPGLDPKEEIDKLLGQFGKDVTGQLRDEIIQVHKL